MTPATTGLRRTPIALAVTALLTSGYTATAIAQESAASLYDEITVTARKREENIQDIPVAVSAVTASQIEDLNIQDLSEVSKLTAGLVFDNEFGRGSNRPVIRGQANILGDSGVSYFIDGVYINGSIADYDLNDIERIEVVKGPQSALYGRNTYSGAINIITKSPGDSFTTDLRYMLSDDDENMISASMRGPIIADTLAGGLTYRYYKLDEPWVNTFDGSRIGSFESTSVSGVLDFTPNDRLNVRLRGYYSERDDGQPPLFAQDSSFNNCFEDNGSLYGGLGRYYCGTVRPGEINTDYTIQAPDTREETESVQTSLVIDYEINDAWSFTSITGYNKTDDVQIIDGDYSPTSFQLANFTPNGFPFAGFPVPPFDYAYAGDIVDFTFANWTEYDDISQELRFEFSGERFSGLFGAYYFDSSSNSRDIRELPASAAGTAAANCGAEFGRMQGVCAANPVCGSIVPFFGPVIEVPRDRNVTDIENIALFGQLEFSLSDAVTATVEARYQEEEVSRVGIVQDLGSPADPAVISNKTFDSFSPRATLQWDLSDDSMVYGVIATGTKPGGFNGTVAIEAGLPSFDEEDVVSLEIGSKNTLADGQLIANVAAFFNQVDGYQLTQNARSGANTVSATVNAGDADVMGVEVELLARPQNAEGLTFTVNYAWTDTEFTSGLDQNQGVLNDAADDGLINCSLGFALPEFPGQSCSTNPGADNNPPAFGSIAGNQIPRTAEHMFFADAELRRPLGNGDWEWFTGINFSYESSKYAQVHNLAETGAATIVNARLGFLNGRYAVNLWGKNITNEDASPLVLRYADANGSFRRSFVGTLRREAHYGITVDIGFGQ